MQATPNEKLITYMISRMRAVLVTERPIRRVRVYHFGQGPIFQAGKVGIYNSPSQASWSVIGLRRV
jgi:hypothetical protein